METPTQASRHGGGGFTEIWKRELGLYQPHSFTRRTGAKEALVKKMALHGKLDGHKGCVNTIHFNPAGDLLVSGSDDKCIILWNWASKRKKFTYASGHTDNVFQALVMPFTDDRIIITSAADGQVRVGHIADNGVVATNLLGTHRDRIHKLAIEPGSPHIFYSCGEDSLVQHFDLRSPAPIKLFLCSSFSCNKTIRLNAIVVDPCNPWYFSVGGFNQYVRVYDRRNYGTASNSFDKPVNAYCPRHLIGSDNVHITGLAYSRMSELLISYNDELVYLFEKGMGLGPNPRFVATEILEKVHHSQMYIGHRNSQTVKGVNFFGTSDDYVVSGSDCGHVYIWKKKGGQLICMMPADKHVVNCVEPHPHFPFLASSGFEKKIKLWMPTSGRQSLPKNAEEIMEANKRAREAHAHVTLSPDIAMHVLRLQQRQALAYVEHRPSTADLESDDDDSGEAFILRLTNPDTSEDDSSADPRECIIC